MWQLVRFTGLDFGGEKMLKLQFNLGQFIMTWPQLYPIQRVDYKCNSGDSQRKWKWLSDEKPLDFHNFLSQQPNSFILKTMDLFLSSVFNRLIFPFPVSYPTYIRFVYGSFEIGGIGYLHSAQWFIYFKVTENTKQVRERNPSYTAPHFVNTIISGVV